MSAAFEARLDASALEGLESRIRRLAASLADTEPLMAALAAELESQSRRRIQSGKAAPDGTPWREWSEGYAETRHGGQSLLQSQGGLLDSLQSFHDSMVAAAGSNLVYAAIQQHGGTPDMAPGPAAIPARAYLGFVAGTQDERDLQAVVDAWQANAIEEALA